MYQSCNGISIENFPCLPRLKAMYQGGSEDTKQRFMFSPKKNHGIPKPQVYLLILHLNFLHIILVNNVHHKFGIILCLGKHSPRNKH